MSDTQDVKRKAVGEQGSDFNILIPKIQKIETKQTQSYDGKFLTVNRAEQKPANFTEAYTCRP